MLTGFFGSVKNYSSPMVKGMEDSVVPVPLLIREQLRSPLYKLKKSGRSRVGDEDSSPSISGL